MTLSGSVAVHMEEYLPLKEFLPGRKTLIVLFYLKTKKKHPCHVTDAY